MALFDQELRDGHRIQLAPLSAGALTCTIAQWRALMAAGLDLGLLEPGARDEVNDQLAAGGMPDTDTDLLTVAPTWLIRADDCHADGTCCEVTELGLVLALLDDDAARSAAATAHVAAIAEVSAHLHGAVVWLLGEHDATGAALEHACVACLTDPYPHARTLETALSQLGQQLALTAASWDLHVEVRER
jgi:hypothetical protein